MIKKFLPQSLKVRIKVALTFFSDLLSCKLSQFARKRSTDFLSNFSLKITQELKPNDAKLRNLLLAQNEIEQLTIRPNEIFSFWKTVGAPTKKRGYKSSRSIQGDQINSSYGGGLCQLSGLIYYASLKAGLEIEERHPHSMDIYDDSTRFAPLGSDATIVYGYKDLRIRNNLDFPIKFSFNFERAYLTISLTSSQKIIERTIDFTKNKINDSEMEVKTYVEHKVIDSSVYKLPSY